MTIRQLLVVVSLLAFCDIAFAGAWGVGAFENDDALDWVWELESSTDLSVIESALKEVIISNSYIEAPTSSAAIAAAEVVAALKGNPHEELPAEVINWTKTHDIPEDSPLIKLAQQVIVRVKNTQHSELAQLWADSREDFLNWKANLADLQERLQ